MSRVAGVHVISKRFKKAASFFARFSFSRKTCSMVKTGSYSRVKIPFFTNYALVSTAVKKQKLMPKKAVAKRGQMQRGIKGLKGKGRFKASAPTKLSPQPKKAR